MTIGQMFLLFFGMCVLSTVVLAIIVALRFIRTKELDFCDFVIYGSCYVYSILFHLATCIALVVKDVSFTKIIFPSVSICIIFSVLIIGLCPFFWQKRVKKKEISKESLFRNAISRILVSILGVTVGAIIVLGLF